MVLKLELAKKGLSLTVLTVFIFLSKQPEALAVCAVVCSFLAFCLNSIPAKKILGYGFWSQVTDILPNLLLSVAMAVPVLLVGRLDIPKIVMLPIQILTGAIVYTLASILVKNENFFFVMKTVRQRLQTGKGRS